jgi:hypothetical protein
MAKRRTFISFDFDNDSDLKTLLVGQSKLPDSPFEIADWSLKAHLTGDWREKILPRIRSVDVVCVICGEQTDKAIGVAAELTIAKELKKEYFLLEGKADKVCKKPSSATANDKMYSWKWDNLKTLIGGGR